MTVFGKLALLSFSLSLSIAVCSPASAVDADVKLITLGTTAGPLPRKDRAQFSNALVAGERLYIVDAGDGLARRIVQAGLDFTKVTEIFITHPHNDHTGGLANLLNVVWQYARLKPLQIIGPPGTEETLQGALAFNKVDEEIRLSENRDKPLSSIVTARNVGVGEIYRDDVVVVTAMENSHFQFAPGSPAFGKYKSYALRFEFDGKTVVFTGDTGPSDKLRTFARGADILVSEALAVDEVRSRLQRAGQWDRMSATEKQGWEKHMSEEHITPEQAGELAAAAEVKTLVLSHLSASGKDNDDYTRFAEAAAKKFKGRIVVAKDLMQISAN
ncbi:MBL fold metallo-hydrolase [Neorhizobium sp. DT-125]|uniref:MBL fold metallo-hydrolase n=1 Tax=Neorhizobium sp. DT-125 TaxID=3396163 RepID=UPI003F1A63B8